jgi:hypothetical protein
MVSDEGSRVTEVKLQNPLSPDLDLTIRDQPWALRVVFLDAMNFMRAGHTCRIAICGHTSKSVDDLDLVNRVNRRRETLEQRTRVCKRTGKTDGPTG